MSPLARQSIPAKLCTTRTPLGNVVEHYAKPNREKSPMSGTGMQWVARCEADPRCPELGPLPARIDMDVSVPNAVVGQNVQHGTSVHAAGHSALELLRIMLASHGVPRHELDLLGVDDVSLRGVTVAFLMICADSAEAERFIDMICVTGRVLVRGYERKESTNVTVTLPDREYTVQAYIKTLLEHCKWAAGAPVDDLLAPMPCIVRVESRLGERFLKARKLTALADWKDAYADGVYESLFNETVRDVLRLEEGLRNRVPREEVYWRLSPIEEGVLRWYVGGHDPRAYPNIAGSKAPAKRFSAVACAILKKAQVDINIPWMQHSQLHCRDLADILRYPGDYRPSATDAPWCFCEENWPSTRKEMRRKYDEVAASDLMRRTAR
ncbi:hypothetical protein C0Z19_10090 [Trinickia soli]|uniref:Uncharacterized protein n=2 Tax=Trinickia soli TaxID=380675 RepID=A0A2N7W7C6_9BURK|nr:hypothetical protein C0Z19_10090 [Trinickia soli]